MVACANPNCAEQFAVSKFSNTNIHVFCCDQCARRMKLPARRLASAKIRAKIREAAKKEGLGTNAFLAKKYESVGWGYAVGVIRSRCKKSGVQCTITPKYLKELFAKQNGVCVLTGWALEKKKSGSGTVPHTCTVDRIRQSEGYVPGNVRLVAFMANSYRYKWDDETLYEFCQAMIQKRLERTGA